MSRATHPLPLPLANLEQFYGDFCGSAGLEMGSVTGVRWYDWLSGDRLVRVHFCDWQRKAAVRGSLPGLLRNGSEHVSVLTWGASDPEGDAWLASQGLEMSLNPWGLEWAGFCTDLSSTDNSTPHKDQPEGLPKDISIERLGPGPLLEEYADIAGRYLIGHTQVSSIQLFARLLAVASRNGIVEPWAAVTRDGHVVATTTLYSSMPCAGLYQVATHPAWRGRGIAAALVRRSLESACGLGAQHVILQTVKPNARRIYERLSFRVTHDYRRWTRKKTETEARSDT